MIHSIFKPVDEFIRNNIQPENPYLKSPEDIYPLLAMSVIWGLYHQTALTFVLKPLARYLFPSEPEKTLKNGGDSGVDLQKHPEDASKVANPNKKNEEAEQFRNKFLMSGWKFLNFGTCVAVGLYTLSQEDWALSRPDYFANYPYHPMSDTLKFYYSVGFGSVLYMFLHLGVEKMTPTDTLIMVAHHLTTLFLIGMSYFYSFHRIGSIILLLHDVSDPIMEIAKMSLYCGKKAAADFFFVVFALVFILSRNVFYPFYVLTSIQEYGVWQDGTPLPTAPVRYSAEVGLWILELMHIYWAFLILKMAVGAILNKGVSDDIRDEDD